jgi:hypothetical protein
MNFGSRSNEFRSKEVWTLKKRGKKLVINQTGSGFMGGGKRFSILVYDRQ